MNRDGDRVTAARERFVDRVGHPLVDKMMQPVLGGGSDVHAWTPAHRFEPFEDLNGIRAVIRAAVRLA